MLIQDQLASDTDVVWCHQISVDIIHVVYHVTMTDCSKGWLCSVSSQRLVTTMLYNIKTRGCVLNSASLQSLHYSSTQAKLAQIEDCCACFSIFDTSLSVCVQSLDQKNAAWGRRSRKVALCA